MSPEAEAAETRAALRLLAAVVAVAVAIYLALPLVVHEDAPLAWYGRTEVADELVARGGRRMYTATHQAWHSDRDETWGDRPLVYILGSSITREAFDVELLQRELDARRQGWGVEKIAFDRGAPLFTWAMLDGMDVRPGDRVLTTVHYDNFRNDWLDALGGFDLYLNHILRPRHLFAIPSLRVAERVEFALSSSPPATFHRAREPFREGLEQWIRYATHRPKKKRNTRPEITPPRPFTDREYVLDFRQNARAEKLPMSPDELVLDASQDNYFALQRFMEEVGARGAEPWVLFLPPGPEYYERFEQGRFSTDFHQHMREHFHPFVRMSPQPQRNYADYKHVNFRGRPVLTRQLAQLLATTPPGVDPVKHPSELQPPRGD